MNIPQQKPAITPAAIEEALEHLLPRLPFWAKRHAQRQLGVGRDPMACVLRSCLCAFLQDRYDCSNLLGIYPDEGVWIQGEQRPIKIALPAWASALIRGLDEEKHVGEPITGTDILFLLARLKLLLLRNGTLWGQGALAAALLREEGEPSQDRLYRPAGHQEQISLSFTITIATRPEKP